MPRLLSIDDDRAIRHLVTKILQAEGVDVATAATAEQGVAAAAELEPDVVLLDLVLPDMSGLEAFDLLRDRDPRLPVILATGEGGSDTAIEAIKRGAYDYITKPLDAATLTRLVLEAAESRRLSSVGVGLNTADGAAGLAGPDRRTDTFIGRCDAMQEVFKAIGRVAPQDVPVLVRGESGTGKELVARALFQHSGRAGGPFLAVNCAALSETLLESELFGHEKGAFTGAHGRRIGKFEQCDGGTLFLDEVGDMSPAVQGKVLRLLQQKTFQRVGGAQTLSADVRIVSATNRDLEAMGERGDFRPDLFYRLNGYSITLPPLRERGDDRLALLRHLLASNNQAMGLDIQGIAPDAVQALLAYDWPGNVREMQSVIRQAMLDCAGAVLTVGALPPEVAQVARSGGAAPVSPTTTAGGSDPAGATEGSGEAAGDGVASNGVGRGDGVGGVNKADHAQGASLAEFITDGLARGAGDLYAEGLALFERQLLTRVLRHTGGNQSEAARLLGITRGSLRNKIRSNGIVIDPGVRVDD
ncbi:MAG: sigma-54 dependent transcriptional regulator [Planctomycetota bacterium]